MGTNEAHIALLWSARVNLPLRISKHLSYIPGLLQKQESTEYNTCKDADSLVGQNVEHGE